MFTLGLFVFCDFHVRVVDQLDRFEDVCDCFEGLQPDVSRLRSVALSRNHNGTAVGSEEKMV
jgi:hypothetical protein